MWAPNADFPLLSSPCLSINPSGEKAPLPPLLQWRRVVMPRTNALVRVKIRPLVPVIHESKPNLLEPKTRYGNGNKILAIFQVPESRSNCCPELNMRALIDINCGCLKSRGVKTSFPPNLANLQSRTVCHIVSWARKCNNRTRRPLLFTVVIMVQWFCWGPHHWNAPTKTPITYSQMEMWYWSSGLYISVSANVVNYNFLTITLPETSQRDLCNGVLLV